MGKNQYRYYVSLATEDYYLQGGEPVGQWWGGATAHFGLGQEVQEAQLRRLFAGLDPLHPRRDPLVQNADSPKRQPGWDLTFSAPKSVSLLWANGSISVHRKIQKVQQQAVEAALTYLEKETGVVRSGKGGVMREAAKWTVAMFEHGTSRALDPQLHTHCLLLNVGLCPDGSTGAITSKAIYQHKMVAGAIYRQELAHGLTRELGVTCERDKSSFRIAGVPEDLVRDSSTRRSEIEAELDKHGTSGPAASAAAALNTRRTKGDVPPREDLFHKWREEGQAHGFKAESVLRKSKVRTPNLNRQLRKSVETLTKGSSSFTKEQLIRETSETAVKYGYSSEALLLATEKFIAKGRHVVDLGVVADHQRLTTKAVLAEEQKFIREAVALARKQGVGASMKDIERTMAKYSRPRLLVWAAVKHHAKQVYRAFLKQPTTQLNWDQLEKQTKFLLNNEQRAALRSITRENRGSIRILEGRAGTGKTQLLAVAREIFEKEGLKVFGVALGGKAARELEERAGIPSHSYAMLQTVMDRSLGKQVKHALHQCWRAALKKPTFKLKPFKLDRKSVLIADEASMLDTEMLTTLIEDCRKAGATLILVGDREQLPAIGRGGGLAYLSDRFGAATLEENVRQQDEADRKVVTDIREGRAEDALKSLKERGHLNIEADKDATIRKLVTDWTERERGSRDQCIIFAPTNALVDELNRKCQAARVAEGELNDKRSAKALKDTLYRGDRVMVTAPSRKYGVVNGDCGTIKQIQGSGRSAVITVTLDRGGEVKISLSVFNDLRLGYAMTTHKGQGQTTTTAYILAGGSMQDREQANVQVSRATGKTHVYVSEADASRLAESLTKSRQKELLAAELARLRAKEQEGRARSR